MLLHPITLVHFLLTNPTRKHTHSHPHLRSQVPEIPRIWPEGWYLTQPLSHLGQVLLQVTSSFHCSMFKYLPHLVLLWPLYHVHSMFHVPPILLSSFLQILCMQYVPFKLYKIPCVMYVPTNWISTPPCLVLSTWPSLSFISTLPLLTHILASCSCTTWPKYPRIRDPELHMKSLDRNRR